MTQRLSDRRPWVVAVCLLGLAAVRCGPPDALEIPKDVVSKRDALDFVRPQVETVDEAPDWATDHPDRKGRWAYGLGVVKARDPVGEPLYAVMREAEKALALVLEREGVRVAAKRGEISDLDVPREAFEFEAIAHDEETDTWYALARLDRAEARKRVYREIDALDEKLGREAGALQATLQAGGTGIAPALAILVGIEQRDQHQRQVEALRGRRQETPDGLDDATLDAAARAALAAQLVRVVVNAPDAEALTETVRSELVAVHLETEEDAGQVSWDWEPEPEDGPTVVVRLQEGGAWSRNEPYRVLEGNLELALDPATSRARVMPVRVVSQGSTAAEANDRIGRQARAEVRSLLRSALRPGATVD